MDESPPVADLHLHTTASDGRLTIDALPDAARADRVDMAAVVDHGRYHPELDTPVVERDDMTVVRGIELHVDTGDRRVDLLGYSLRERPTLVKTVERLQRNRVKRAREIAAAIEGETGVHFEIDIHDGAGQPHVARAIDVSEAPCDCQDAFNELIGTGGPCYVACGLPTFGDGVATLRDTYNVVGLVHPFHYRGPADTLELCASLDAIERYYSYDFDVKADLVEEVVERYSLLATGGGDAHDETLGHAGPPETDSARFAAAVGGL